LVIVCTGVYRIGGHSGQLTHIAFETGLPGSGWMVSAGIIMFAYSTIISWSYYGDRATDYLFGKKAVFYYRLIYVTFVFIGSISTFPTVINFCDSMNGLMAIPNLTALILLAPAVSKLNKDYFNRLKNKNNT